MSGARKLKAAAVASSVAIALSILTSHRTGQIYPFTHLSITAGVVGVFLLAAADEYIETTWKGYLGLIVALSVAFRLRIVFFPASMLGIDPDRYAIEVSQIAQFGGLDVLSFWFYREAPIHLLEAVIISLLLDVPSPLAHASYAVILGIGIPLLAATMAIYLIPRAPLIGIFAAGAAGLLGYTVQFSYSPVANTTGVLFILFALYTGYVYVIGDDRRFLPLALLLIVGGLYTHKFSGVVLLFGFLGMATGVEVGHSANRTPARRRAIPLLTATGALLYLQMFQSTNLGVIAVLRTLSILVPGEAVQPIISEPTAATDPYTLTDRVFRLFYVVMLLGVSGVVWVWWVWESMRSGSRPRNLAFLGMVAPLAALVPMAVPMGVNPTRTIFFSEVLLVVLVGVGLISGLFSDGRRGWYIKPEIILLIVVFLAVLGTSPVSAPDYSGVDRRYLTENEVSAKIHGERYATPPVVTDLYYAEETPPTLIPQIEEGAGVMPGKFTPGSEAFLNRKFNASFAGTIAHRRCLDLYRASGVWRLTWDPESHFNQLYNRVYDSECVGYYQNDPTQPT